MTGQGALENGMHAVITENDESQWNDEPGQRYHFPARYKALLQPGTRLIYYKGTLRDPKFAASRLSPEPHYFATAIAGAFVPDTSSKKGDQFLPVEQFRRFPEAVPIRLGGELFETIPTSLQSNYWRYGVRPISAETYLAIIAAAGLLDSASGPDPALTTYAIEGGKRVVY